MAFHHKGARNVGRESGSVGLNLMRMQVGDMLRATIVCADGKSVLEAWQRCSSADGFNITPEHGRLLNHFGTTDPRPPNMLLNAHVERVGCLPIAAEVQIHLLGIFELKEHHHRYYEIRRANSIAELIKENETALSILESEPSARLLTQSSNPILEDVDMGELAATHASKTMPEFEMAAQAVV